MRSPPAWMLLALCVLCLAGPALAEDKKDKPKDELSKEEQALLELTNKERAREKLPPLKADPTLSRLAREHSANMAKKKEMNHVLDGKNPQDRVRASGYRASYVGENIAQADFEGMKMEGFIKMWMDSKPHRANILHEKYQEIGLGVVHGEGSSIYCTQVFARPAPKR